MWFEKYRPKSFKDMVGRQDFIEKIQPLINREEGIPHILLHGPQGTGKTTAARVIANEVFQGDYDRNFFEFNASQDRGIDVVRNQISDIAKRRPFNKQYKIILMDESDYLTPEAQACFRRPLELYSPQTRFIFTANYPFRLIGPLISRFVAFEFDRLETKPVAMFLKKIAKNENLTKTDAELIDIAKRTNGDLRKAIGILEGDLNASELDSVFQTLTIKKLKSMSEDERVKLAFSGDPEDIFGKIWEMVQRENEWSLLESMADCNNRMNFSVHKTLFLANFLAKAFSK